LAPIVALVLGSAWFVAVVTRGVTYEADLPPQRAILAGAGGLIGWIIISSIFSRGLI
jgi:hypothetical protein